MADTSKLEHRHERAIAHQHEEWSIPRMRRIRLSERHRYRSQRQSHEKLHRRKLPSVQQHDKDARDEDG